MAKVHVTLSTPNSRAQTGATLPLLPATPRIKRRITPTGASVANADLIAEAGEVWQVTSDVAIDVDFGGTPDAATEPDQLVLAGTTREFPAVDGDKIAIKTSA